MKKGESIGDIAEKRSRRRRKIERGEPNNPAFGNGLHSLDIITSRSMIALKSPTILQKRRRRRKKIGEREPM